jgi:hypothetical protein
MKRIAFQDQIRSIRVHLWLKFLKPLFVYATSTLATYTVPGAKLPDAALDSKIQSTIGELSVASGRFARGTVLDRFAIGWSFLSSNKSHRFPYKS